MLLCTGQLRVDPRCSARHILSSGWSSCCSHLETQTEPSKEGQSWVFGWHDDHKIWKGHEPDYCRSLNTTTPHLIDCVYFLDSFRLAFDLLRLTSRVWLNAFNLRRLNNAHWLIATCWLPWVDMRKWRSEVLARNKTWGFEITWELLWIGS
jgi:hypothetical protein